MMLVLTLSNKLLSNLRYKKYKLLYSYEKNMNFSHVDRD